MFSTEYWERDWDVFKGLDNKDKVYVLDKTVKNMFEVNKFVNKCFKLVLNFVSILFISKKIFYNTKKIKTNILCKCFKLVLYFVNTLFKVTKIHLNN